MNETVKMKLKNSEGKEIVKDVPKELYSNYLSIGWTEVKPEKENKPLIDKFDKDKKKDNENL